MKKKLAAIIIIAIIVTSGFVYYKKVLQPSNFLVSTLDTHIGAATLKVGHGEIPENLYSDTGIQKTDKYGSFTKAMTVYGITFIARDDISDDFLKAVAETLKEMFQVNENTNVALQEGIIRNMYKYKTLIPVVKSEKNISLGNKDVQKFYNENSVCDIIMANTGNPHRETIEHLLHSISNVGLHYELNQVWGLSQSSELYNAMQDAINNKQYMISDYKSFKKNGDIYNRVLLQEYAYWLITSEWGFQSSYGEKEEWTLNTSELVGANHMSGHQVFESIKDVLYLPSNETIEVLKSFSNKK